MGNIDETMIVVTDLDKLQAFSTFNSVFAMTKLKIRFKIHLNKIRKRIQAKKQKK